MRQKISTRPPRLKMKHSPYSYIKKNPYPSIFRAASPRPPGLNFSLPKIRLNLNKKIFATASRPTENEEKDKATRNINDSFGVNLKLIPYQRIGLYNSKKYHKYINFEEKNIRNSKTGAKGEDIVLKREKDFLIKIGRKDLADKVKQISTYDISAGYDIFSFTENGESKFIEVKSTILSKAKSFSFILSKNEKEMAENSQNYFIYLVFEVNSRFPKIFMLKNPFSSGMLYLEPTQYIVKGLSQF